MVTFGGAYAVLAYVAQQAVDHYGWLKPGEMLDGLGMAETTPGPLIMVTQFVGFMAAYRAPGSLHQVCTPRAVPRAARGSWVRRDGRRTRAELGEYSIAASNSRRAGRGVPL